MKIEELNIQYELRDFLRLKGLSELYPPQELALKHGLLEGRNIVISSPTASGKTLVALVAAYNKIKKDGKKVVYLAPLRALAYEKYSEFSELKRLSIKTSISTGDYDSSGENLGNADIIVTTNERFDSILRHQTSWLNDVGLFIADEVHLAGSDSRGPTLEMILTKVIYYLANPQILALSATISNCKEIAEWLNAELVEINWRPVPLREGVFEHGRIIFSDKSEKQISVSILGHAVDLALDTVIENGQALIFTSTRKRAVNLAKSCSNGLDRLIGKEDKEKLRQASNEIKNAAEETTLSKTLAEFVSKGAAFHHAGLAAEHRRIVEDYFRAGYIKILTATPTLAAGVNLPARRVVIADISRYDSETGVSEPISVLEYKQMAGRAGRPQYDKYGETIIVATVTLKADELFEKYIFGKPESIVSRLSDHSSFRFHMLATIASSKGLTLEKMVNLFNRTLFARQSSKTTVKRMINSSLSYLLEEDFIKKEEDYYFATEFGKRVSMLYIDPVTAVIFREGLSKLDPSKDQTCGILNLISSVPDFEPKMPLREKDYDLAIQFFEDHRSEFTIGKSRSFSEFDEILRNMRMTMVLFAWIDEWREEDILTRLGVEPGDLHRAKENADWLLYSLGELSKLFGRKELNSKIELTRKRVQHGVSEELLELTSLQGIGRVRARALYSSGFKTLDDLKEASAEMLANVSKIGQALARRIKEQVGS